MPRFVAALLVAVVLAIGLYGPSVAARQATPSEGETPTECNAPDVAPGTPTVEEASPVAEYDGALTVATPELPAGEPASATQAAAAEEAILNVAGCLNAGEHLKTATLYTERGLLEECGTTNIYDGPLCWEGIPPITNVVVSDVQVHDDGRLSADVTYKVGYSLGHERFFLVEQDGALLLDSNPDLPVDVPEEATVITGELTDFAFVLSDNSAPAGTIAFEVTNTGEYPHEVVMLRLPEGATIDDLLADESLFEQVEFLGFTFAMPDQDAPPMIVVDVPPGVYTMVCFIDEPEGIPHVMRGMVLEFEVTEP